jgi:hypothetical protein
MTIFSTKQKKFMKEPQIEELSLKLLTLDDYSELKTVMINSYQTMPNSYWKESQIKRLLDIFPDGQVVILVNGKIAGCALSIIVDSNLFPEQHTYRQVTGNLRSEHIQTTETPFMA